MLLRLICDFMTIIDIFAIRLMYRGVSKSDTERCFVLAKVNTIIFISTDPEKRNPYCSFTVYQKYHNLPIQASKNLPWMKLCSIKKFYYFPTPNKKIQINGTEKNQHSYFMSLFVCVCKYTLYSILHISVQPDHIQLPTRTTTIKVT